MKLLVLLCVFTVGCGLPITLYYQKTSPPGGHGSSIQQPFSQETYHFPIPPSDFLFRRVGTTPPPPSTREALKFPLSYRIPIYRSLNTTSNTSSHREAKHGDNAAMSRGFSWANMFFYILAIDADSLVWPSALEWLDKRNYDDELSLTQEQDFEELDSPTSIEDIQIGSDGNTTEATNKNSLVAPTSASSSQLEGSERDQQLLLGDDDKINSTTSSTTTSRAIHDADEVPTALPLLEKEVAVEIATEVTLSSDEIASTPREVYESKKNQTALISEEETTTVSSLENY